MRFFILLLVLSAHAAEPPSLILYDGKVMVAPGRTEQAVAVAGSNIAAVGSDADVLALKIIGTRLVDLKGRTVVPGFHDAHVHFMKGSLTLVNADLNGTASLADVQKRLLDWLSRNPEKEWALGRGWDQTAWPGKAYPTKADLDAVVSTQPVVLTHVDGHILWLNSEALKRAGLKAGSPDPAGAKALRGPGGEPTGIVEKEKSDLLAGVEPEPDTTTLKGALAAGVRLANRWGVTSIQGPLDIEPEAQLELWRQLEAEIKVPIRYFIWGPMDRPKELKSWRKKFKDLPKDKFRFGGLKGFVDGVMSNWTAALVEPYSDSTTTRGKANYDEDQLAQFVEDARAERLQSVFHAVGDAAVHRALDACEASERRMGPGKLGFCKIEHIELVQPEDIERFRKIGVVASMQPSHMTYDNEEENYNPARLGDRIKYAFAWKSFEQAKVLLTFGTDWPVVPLEPRIELFAATTREHFNGKPEGGWVPEQKISLESALWHYTLDPAKAIGRDDELGTLEKGKLADLVVLDRDLLATSGLDLLKLDVDMTMFDGRVVYERTP